MRVLAIDPGTDHSAWLLWSSAVEAFGYDPNERLLESLRDGEQLPDVVVIEKIESYGMAVGAEVFATVHWAGRFTEAAYPTRVHQLSRMKVKMHLCGSARAKDPNIRQALLDRFGGRAAQGTKRLPGPLYGVSGDVWAALAVAATYVDGVR